MLPMIIVKALVLKILDDINHYYYYSASGLSSKSEIIFLGVMLQVLHITELGGNKDFRTEGLVEFELLEKL